MGTTAQQIAKIILSQEHSGLVDLSSYRTRKAAAKDARELDDRLRELSTTGYDPAHAAFVYAQNFAAYLSEKLSPMPDLRQYVSTVGGAEDDYLPSFPPGSPVTTSYFTTWAFFDVLFGESHETIGTCLLRLARDVPFPDGLVDAINAMQQSRMGFYVHDGFADCFIRLREIDGEDVKLCHVPSGFRGQKGQIWFGRLIPPMNDLVTYHVFFTTPYILIQTPETVIAAYLKREIKRLDGSEAPREMDAREFVLKHGPSPTHWLEYIFCAYSNHRHDAVFIAGIPDDRESLPHGRLMRARS
jgi:hypothetical protein